MVSCSQQPDRPPHTSGRPSGAQRLVSQARNIVLNVFNYFDYEKRDPIDVVTKKTSDATKVSESVIQKIRTQSKKFEGGVIKSPLYRHRLSPILGAIDDFDKDAIRRAILAFYERGDLPTLDSLLEIIRGEPISFKGSRASLWRLIRSLGFRYKKHCSNRAILMERSDIVAARSKFLRELKLNRCSENPRPEVYIDETWMNQNTHVERCWTNEQGTIGPHTKTGKGGRFIIVHAGSSQGFVPGALLMFKSKVGNKGDYHDSMNCDTFKKWFLDQLLPNIPARSLIIMDNAPYHNIQLNKAPSGNSRKAEIIQWLKDNSIPHNSSHTRVELLQLVKLHKKSKVCYELDHIAATAGHQVLRLPPYYCQFNAIELIWAQIKEEVKKKNSNDKQHMKRVEELTRQAIDHVTPDNWRKCIEHTIKVQEDYIKKDLAVEYMVESFTIQLDETDYSSEDSNEDE